MKWLATSLAFAIVCSASAQQPPKSAFSQVPEAVPDTLRFLVPLGDFHATDTDGHQWGIANFTGKVTLIDIWATTCGPCLLQHPEIQRFYDKWKGSDQLQVLTFSIDKAPSAVQRYMAAKKYTFPVIVSADISEKLFSNLGIPQSWVVDRRSFRSEVFRSWSLGRILTEAERLMTSTRK